MERTIIDTTADSGDRSTVYIGDNLEVVVTAEVAGEIVDLMGPAIATNRPVSYDLSTMSGRYTIFLSPNVPVLVDHPL